MIIDAEVVGKLAELDMVTMDLERANGRIIQLEKKVVGWVTVRMTATILIEFTA